MPRITYVNGRYLPHNHAMVHVEDRGFQFADSVYEVLAVEQGRACHLDQHLDRLDRSLAALAIAWPVPRRVLGQIVARVVARNRLCGGVVYIQVSRGVARRNHFFPADTPTSLVVSAWAHAGPAANAVRNGVRVLTCPDIRWKRPDIKTTGLLPNLLARQAAREAGAFEAVLVDPAGWVTEGSSSNLFAVLADGTLATHPADQEVLGGVTRANVLALARAEGMSVAETAFTLADLVQAREAFLTGTTITVLPVVQVDDMPIGDGRPGPVSRRLRQLYQGLRLS